MNKLELQVNNYSYSSWLRVNISLSMNALSGIAELTTVNFFPGNIAGWDIKLGQPFKLLLDDTKLLTGYIDHIESIYKNKSHYIKLVLRDKTSDLIDCNWNGNVSEWKNQTVLNILNKICDNFNIDVSYDSEVSTDIQQKIETFKINEGEYISDAIMRICNPFDLIPISNGTGTLHLTKSTQSKKSHDAIDCTGNVLERISIDSNMDRYSEYIVKGIGYGSENKNNYEDYIHCYGSVEDSVVNRNRPIVFFDGVTNSGKCQEYAKWMKQVKAGVSRGKNYIVSEWLQTNGVPWKINNITRVYDPFIELDKDMLISNVRFFYNEGDGRKAELIVVNKGTYSKTLTTIKSGFDE